MKKWLQLSLGIGLLSQFISCGESQPQSQPQTHHLQGQPHQATPQPAASFIRAVTGSPAPATSDGVSTLAPSCASLPTQAGSSDNLKVDLWPWGAEAAISLTIDEGLKEPYDILMPEIELRGWRASFYIYTLQPTTLKSWDRVVLAAQRGHEVSNHTYSHPDLTKLSEAEVRKELQGGIDDLRSHLGADFKLTSFAYPYESTDARTSKITLEYHRYNRAGDKGAPTPPYPINDAHKPDFGALKAKAPTRTVSLASWNSWVDATVQAKGWFIEELHGVEDVGVKGGWEPRTIEEFRKHFDHIESFGDKIWVAPVINVGNYIEEREAAKPSVRSWSATGAEFSLEDGFDFKEPLTLQVSLPTGWQGQVSASQHGKALEVRTVSPGVIRVAAVPDGSPVCLLPR